MSREGEAQESRVITLDGLSGSGKSTLARLLAEALGWTFLDSGGWYRALAWAVLEAGADPEDAQAVTQTLSELSITSSPDGTVAVDGHVPGAALRTPRIDAAVGRVADHFQVRAELNARMRATAAAAPGGVVADGRDAGTVIFPDASLQVFVEASLAERARRRHAQAGAGGNSLDAVRDALASRDARDAARGDAAPRATARSRILDNQANSVEEAVGCLLAWARERFPA